MLSAFFVVAYSFAMRAFPSIFFGAFEKWRKKRMTVTIVERSIRFKIFFWRLNLNIMSRVSDS
jgi:hypothetical protein